MKIVFMGTPDFAVPCLDALINSKHQVTGVFTQPDKPKGRKAILTPPPIKELAEKHGIPVFQPTKMKDGTALEMLKSCEPDLVIVVAYGKILPKDILEFPKYGCINIHASLLPSLRGAAPIQWSIINGFEKTGVTSMLMDEGLDTGDMLLMAETPITENMNAVELHDILSQLGAKVMLETVEKLEKGELVPVEQDHEKNTYAPMLSKENSPIDWTKSAQEVHNQIRGLCSWPCATAVLEGKTFKIHKSRLCDKKGSFPGEIVRKDSCLVVTCGDGNCIEILELQAENKKAMTADNYMRGNPIFADRFN